MADISGVRATTNIDQGRRRVDMDTKIHLLDPDAAPLYVLAGRLNSKPTVNPEFSWNEDDLEPRFDAVNNGAGYNSSATSVVVDNGAYFYADSLAKVTRTGEVLRVTAVSTNTLTVVRGVGGGAAALVDNDELLIIGATAAEGSLSPTARSNNPTKVTNYAGITKTKWSSSETLIHSDTFTEPTDWNYNANKKGIEHKKTLEYKAWLGKPSENTTDTAAPIRTSGGVFNYVTTNVTAVGGALTEATFFGALRPIFRYGVKNSKVAFCSQLAVDVLNGFARGKLELIQANRDDTYGVTITNLLHPRGNLKIVEHYLLEGAVYGGYIAVLDMSNIARRPLANSEGSRDSHVIDGIQPPDADRLDSQWLTEVGLQFALNKSHGLLSGITS